MGELGNFLLLFLLEFKGDIVLKDITSWVFICVYE